MFANRVLMRKNALCLITLFVLAACDTGSERVATSPPVASITPTHTAAQPLAPTLQPTAQLWSRSCALCHVDGNAFAPRIGNVEEWRPRLAKGRQLLLEHTLEGFGQMPPLGYCMACDRDDFLALIDFMTIGIIEEPRS